MGQGRRFFIICTWHRIRVGFGTCGHQGSSQRESMHASIPELPEQTRLSLFQLHRECPVPSGLGPRESPTRVPGNHSRPAPTHTETNGKLSPPAVAGTQGTSEGTGPGASPRPAPGHRHPRTGSLCGLSQFQWCTKLQATSSLELGPRRLSIGQEGHVLVAYPSW